MERDSFCLGHALGAGYELRYRNLNGCSRFFYEYCEGSLLYFQVICPQERGCSSTGLFVSRCGAICSFFITFG